jgi:gluconolactonase
MKSSVCCSASIVLALVWVVGSGPAARGHDESNQYSSIGEIERADPRFDALIPQDAVLEKLAEGFEWSEGPVWMPDGYVVFSDIPNNAVMKWKEGQGLSVYLKPSGYTGQSTRGGELGSNGLLLDASDRLVLCQHGNRQVARVEKDGGWTVLVDRYRGKRLNSPNDAVYKSNGDLYFTDPPYGLVGKDRETLGELGFCGVYRLGTDNRLTLLTDQMTRPNGIGFSPDEKTLYVAQSDPKRAIWMAYDVTDDGRITNGRVFFDATDWVGKLPGLPDGMAIDRSGNLFATGPGGVHVFAPDGSFLGRINPGVPTANCCFGEDGSVLYVTADMYLCRIKTKTKGLRVTGASW